MDFYDIVTWQLKGHNCGARRRSLLLGNGSMCTVALCTHMAMEELLETVFSMQPVLRLYNEDQQDKPLI
jgi:hypothetical protein